MTWETAPSLQGACDLVEKWITVLCHGKEKRKKMDKSQNSNRIWMRGDLRWFWKRAMIDECESSPKSCVTPNTQRCSNSLSYEFQSCLGYRGKPCLRNKLKIHQETPPQITLDKNEKLALLVKELFYKRKNNRELCTSFVWWWGWENFFFF